MTKGHPASLSNSIAKELDEQGDKAAWWSTYDCLICILSLNALLLTSTPKLNTLKPSS